MTEQHGDDENDGDDHKGDRESDSEGHQKLGPGHRANSTSFKKGVSGNLSGRPKGSRNRKTIVAAAANAKVTFNENGKRVRRTKFEVSQIQLANKAAGGDIKAIGMQNEFHFKLGLLGSETGSVLPQLGANDELVMADIIRRIRASDVEPPDSPNHPNDPPANPRSPQGVIQ
jgi:Family of unknown function (DUF5681)